jgi:Flp pilus assembly protein TadD
VVALAGLVYLPSLKHDFVWDDQWMIAENKDLDAATPFGFFGQSFTHAWASQGMGPQAYYRPVPVTSFWLEKTMWGGGPVGFHRSNVVMNAVAGILVALLFMELLGSVSLALLASLAFALHAAHVESVAFVVGRTDILMTIFLVAAFLALLRYQRADTRVRPYWIVVMVAAYALALFSKEAAILFPVFAWLVPGSGLRPGRNRRDRLLLAALALVGAGYLAVRALVLRGPAPAWGSVTAVQRVFLVLNSFGRYAVLSIFPFFHRLSYSDLPGFARFGWPTIAALASLAALAWLGVRLSSVRIAECRIRNSAICIPNSALAVTGGLWFALFMLPACDFFPPGPSLLSERLLYAPVIGTILVLFAAGRAIARTRGLRRLLAAGALAWAAAMGASVIAWLPVWQSDYSLQVVRAREAPDNAVIHADLATMMRERKDNSGAVRELGRAAELKPDSVELRLSLGELLKQTGDQTGAERELRRAVALKPKLAEAHVVLGNLLIEKGDLVGAIAECRQGVLLDPQQALAHNNLGVALQQAGEAAEAESEFRRALGLQPDLGLALNNLGEIMMAQGKLDSAEQLLRRSVAAQPDYALAHFNLGRVFERTGRTDEAGSEYRRTLELMPDFTAAREHLQGLRKP